MRLSHNNSITLPLIVAALLLVVNQAVSFGIHRQPIPSQPHHLNRRLLKQSKLHYALFNLPGKLTTDSRLKQSEDVVSENESSRIPKAYSYHLLWTPGFAPKVMLSTSLLALGHKFTFPYLMNHSTSNATMGWISSVLLSLLASSCCLIQLLANVLISTVGCLGLNTALGPVRPYFFSLLLYINALSVSKGLSTIPQIVVRSIIALLPEGLHLWTNYRNLRYRNGVQAENKDAEVVTEDSFNSCKPIGESNTEPSTNKEPVNDGSFKMALELDVPTMGCVSCINKIDSSMRKSREGSIESNKVHYVSSMLHPDKPKGGKTVVLLSVGSEEEAEEIGQGLVEQLDNMGFPGASIISKETLTTR